MKKSAVILSVTLLLAACQAKQPEPSNEEIHMAKMMGVTVEELRNMTDEEHIKLMQELMKEDEPATEAEKSMAEAMGITVEELRNMSDEEHMKMMNDEHSNHDQHDMKGEEDDDHGHDHGMEGDVFIDIIADSQDGEPHLSKSALVIYTETKVVWHNTDDVTHFILSDDGSMVSPAIEPGEEWEFVFQSPGTYEYGSIEHPSVKGTVLVK